MKHHDGWLCLSRWQALCGWTARGEETFEEAVTVAPERVTCPKCRDLLTELEAVGAAVPAGGIVELRSMELTRQVLASRGIVAIPR
jgi:hypothetical protein